MSWIIELSRFLIEEPHLLFLILDFVLDVENSLAVIFDGWKNEILCSTSCTNSTVEIEALAVLKGSWMWLNIPVRTWSVWLLTTLKNIKLECHITIEWNWLSTQWRNDMSTSPNVVSWAWKFGVITLSEFGDGKLPAFEYLLTTNCELFWVAEVFLSWIGYNSSIGESSNPMNSGPISSWANWSTTLGGDVNTDIWDILISVIAVIVLSIWSVDIWTSTALDMNSLSRSNQSCYLRIFHFYNNKLIII